MEWDEWVLVEALLSNHSRVLEFGARYGTTSCVLSRATGNRGNVVSVEVDQSVKRFVLANREYFECNFHLFLGSVSNVPLEIGNTGADYATASVAVPPGRKSLLPHATFQQIEEKVGYKFNTLLIDCEGCASFILSKDLMDQIELIIIEHDGDPAGHTAVFKMFQDHGFECIWTINDTYDPEKNWSRQLKHSAWRKGGLGNLKTCESFKQDKHFTDSELKCLPTYKID